MLDHAVAQAGYKAQAATLTRDALLRNLDIAGKLGCLDAAGLAEMRHGKAVTVTLGPYAGDQLSVDHIIPRAVVPELDNVHRQSGADADANECAEELAHGAAPA